MKMKITKKNGTEIDVELDLVFLEREGSCDDNIGVIARIQGGEIGSVTSMTGPDWHTYLDGLSINEDYRDTDLGVCLLKHLYEHQATEFVNENTVTVYALKNDIREPVAEYVNHILMEAESVGVFNDRTTPQTRPRTEEVIRLWDI